MPEQLPPYVLAILPPLYVAFTRMLARFKLSGSELLSLFLLRSSPVTIGDRKVLLLTDLIERISFSMGYVQSAPASDLIGKLNNRGLIQKMHITDGQREALFPKGKRNSAVFLEAAGDRLFQDFCSALEDATREFLAQLPPDVRDRFYLLFATAAGYESLGPVLEEAFLSGPDDETRFITACKSFLEIGFSELPPEIPEWYKAHVGTMSDEKLGGFLDELERSVASTPDGLMRRAGSADNSDPSKLLVFLENLIRKHRDAQRP